MEVAWTCLGENPQFGEIVPVGLIGGLVANDLDSNTACSIEDGEVTLGTILMALGSCTKRGDPTTMCVLPATFGLKLTPYLLLNPPWQCLVFYVLTNSSGENSYLYRLFYFETLAIGVVKL